MSETKIVCVPEMMQMIADAAPDIPTQNIARDWLHMHAQLARVRAAVAELKSQYGGICNDVASGIIHAAAVIEAAMEGEQ